MFRAISSRGAGAVPGMKMTNKKTKNKNKKKRERKCYDCYGYAEMAVKGRRRAGQVAVCAGPHSCLCFPCMWLLGLSLSYSRCLEWIHKTILPLMGFELKDNSYVNFSQNQVESVLLQKCLATIVVRVFSKL